MAILQYTTTFRQFIEVSVKGIGQCCWMFVFTGQNIKLVALQCTDPVFTLKHFHIVYSPCSHHKGNDDLSPRMHIKQTDEII